MGQGLCHFARMCACIGLQPTGLQDFIVGNKGWGWVGNCATLHQYVPAGWQPTGLFSDSLSLFLSAIVVGTRQLACQQGNLPEMAASNVQKTSYTQNNRTC